MDLKKQQILENALSLFLEKGYPKTSMQDIAERCNFSKATLYKFFDSKEGIGILAVFYMTEQVRAKIEAIMEREELSPADMLRESVLVRMEDCFERNRFMDELILSLTSEQRENCMPGINKSRYDLFELFLNMMMKAFGIDSEALAAELTINLNGLMREICIVASDQVIELDEGATADFMVESLEAILEKRRGKQTILTQGQLEKLRRAVENQERNLRPVFRKKRIMRDLQAALADYEKSGCPGRLEAAEGLLRELKGLELNEEE